MRKINFVGEGYSDVVLFLARYLRLLEKKVVIIDTTHEQRLKFSIPVVDGIDESKNAVNYMGSDYTTNAAYDTTDYDVAISLYDFACPTDRTVEGLNVLCCYENLASLNMLLSMGTAEGSNSVLHEEKCNEDEQKLVELMSKPEQTLNLDELLYMQREKDRIERLKKNNDCQEPETILVIRNCVSVMGDIIERIIDKYAVKDVYEFMYDVSDATLSAYAEVNHLYSCAGLSSNIRHLLIDMAQKVIRDKDRKQIEKQLKTKTKRRQRAM